MSHNSRHNSLKPTGRKELLLWLNSLCSSTYPFVEALRDGAAYCSVVEAAVRRVASNTMAAAENSVESRRASKCAHKAAALLRQVKWDATVATCETANASKDPLAVRNACEHNFNLLVELITDCIPREFALTVDVDRLSQGKLQDHLAVLQWLYDFMSRLLVQYSVEAIVNRLATHETKKETHQGTKNQRSTHSTPVGNEMGDDSQENVEEGEEEEEGDVDSEASNTVRDHENFDTHQLKGRTHHGASAKRRDAYGSKTSRHIPSSGGNDRSAESSGADEFTSTPEAERSYSAKSWGRQSYDKSSKHVSFVGDSLTDEDTHGPQVEPVSSPSTTTATTTKSAAAKSSSKQQLSDRHDSANVDFSADPSLLALRNEVEAFEAVVLEAQNTHQSNLSPAAGSDGAVHVASEVTLASLGQLLDKRDALWQALDAIETATLIASARSISSNASAASANNYVYAGGERDHSARNELLEELCALFNISFPKPQ